MSRLNILIKNTRRYAELAPIPETTYCYLSDNASRGLLKCRRIGIDGEHNKQLRFSLVQQLWEGVPCLD